MFACVELVQQQVFDPLSSGVTERLAPQVTGNVGELLRQRHDFHFEHQAQAQRGVVFSAANEVHERGRRSVVSRNLRALHFNATQPELGFRKR